MDFLNQNISWLEDLLVKYIDHYIIFDLPGNSYFLYDKRSD